MSATTLRQVLPVVLLLTLACASPEQPPPQEIPAPVLTTPSRLEAQEGQPFSHRIEITSQAPPVALALVGAPSGLTIDATGQLAWTPDFEQAGEHVFTVVATDAQAEARTTRLDLTIVVAHTNRAPTTPMLAAEETFPMAAGATFTVTAQATDPDGDALTYDWSVSDEAWSLLVDGESVTVTATEARDASAVLTVVVSDGFATTSATLSLSTRPNEAPGHPVLDTDATFPVRAGATFTVTAQATDPDGDALTYDWSVSDQTWSLVADGDAVTVTATGTRDASALLTVVVSDGFASASATLALSTLPNEAPGAPVLHTETTFPVRDGAQISFTASAVDPDGDTLTYEWSVSDGSWTLEATGASAIVTPTERGSTAVLTVTVSDGDLTASASRELASTANVAPTVTLAPADATLLATTTLTLSVQGYDADADALTYAWSVDGEGWAIEADGAAAIVTAPEVVDAAATVTVTATDGWGGEATASHALTTTGVALRGTVDFLQSGTFSIEAPGGERVQITANGAFAIPTTRLSPRTPWTLHFASQPVGQRCSVAGGNGGTVGLEDVELSIVCSLIAQRRSEDYFNLSTTSETYESLSLVEPVSFELSKPAHALVTLSVSHVVAELEEEGFGKVWLGVAVDGVVVEEAVWQDDRGSQGGPLGLVTTVPLPAGAHTLEAVWRISDGADRGFIEGVLGGSVTLTASVVESLAMGLGGVRAEDSLEGTTTSQTPTLPVALTPPTAALALATAQVPEAHATDEVVFNLMKGSTAVAEGRIFHPESAHAVPLATLHAVEAGELLALDWSSPGVATLGASPVSLSAALFDPRVQTRTARATAQLSIGSSTYQTLLTLGDSALTLSESRPVLVVFQAPTAFVTFSNAAGELALEVDGKVTARALIRSRFVGPEAPVVLAAMVDLPAGDHTIKVVGRRESTSTLHLSSGLRSLSAIVLD